jgi:serine/threonine-protein kinase
MAAIAADRNLLLGLLALQNGLINQAQLVAAFHAWTLDKVRVLADHLIALGHLTDAQRAVVEAMVDLHVAKHGGFERSLAAIPAGRSTRESLAQLGDFELGASIAHLGPASTQAGDNFDRTASYSVGMATSEGQRFRILRPHAQGGLGAVFVALDSELHREVALKQILDQHADDPTSRHRFVIEAEITGGLEHPGIVPVYGLGVHSDGRPYYAMRFVRGDSLKEAIARFHADAALKTDSGARSLELRKLLRRFLDVCNAIDYAHNRGVLHRDIKPANVIVGRHGETLVVDWGLAKALGRSDPGSGERTLLPSSASGSAETLPGSALGTPAYMSPEQAHGDLERLGPRSDVHSLGATLYCLVTGQPPLAGDDPGAILQAVQRGEFRPPRALDSTIDPAMEAVCLKAMALKPEDRYGTPRALAEDIERWMADEPVGAWREPVWRRARRWARRNRTAVTTAAAAVLVALAGTLIVLVVQTRANRDLRQANAQTRRERDLARRNFDLAQQNFELARKAVDDYLTRVGQNPLLKEQGLHALRQELLELALGYYRDFLAQRSDDPSLRVETAAAHQRVGDIQIELGQPGEALAAYDQALALIEPLVRERPGDLVLATAQVRLEAGRLQALKVGSRYPEAISAFERTKTLGEALLASGQGTQDLPEILACTNRDAAIVLHSMGRLDGAVRAALRAHELAERATRDRPGDLPAARTRLYAAIIASELLLSQNGNEEARGLSEQEFAFGKTVVLQFPRDVELRRDLATLQGQLSWIQRVRGRLLEALQVRRGAAETLGALARENPLLVQVRSDLSLQLDNLSVLQTDLGQYGEAKQSARAAIEVNETLIRDVPSSSFFRMKAGRGYGTFGKALLKAGSHAEALAMLRKGVAILETSDAPWDLYNLASFLSLASTAANPDEGPSAVDRRRRDADRAVAAIRRAIELGLTDSRLWKAEIDFDVLHARPDFQALLMDLDFPADPLAH